MNANSMATAVNTATTLVPFRQSHARRASLVKTHHRDKERHKWQVHAGGFIHECVKTHKHGRHHHIEQQGGDKHVA